MPHLFYALRRTPVADSTPATTSCKWRFPSAEPRKTPVPRLKVSLVMPSKDGVTDALRLLLRRNSPSRREVSVTQQVGRAAQLSNRWSIRGKECCSGQHPCAIAHRCRPHAPVPQPYALYLPCLGFAAGMVAMRFGLLHFRYAAALRAARRSSHECLSALIASAPSVGRNNDRLRMDLSRLSWCRHWIDDQ